MKKLESLFSNAALLVVEDYPFNLEIIVEMLRMMGIEPDTASNGEEAVEKVKNKRYDLILMDLLMPKMDGYEAAKLIRHLPIEQPIIAALTASAQPADRKKCLEVGMNDFLAKPLTLTDLEIFLRKNLPEKLIPKEKP